MIMPFIPATHLLYEGDKSLTEADGFPPELFLWGLKRDVHAHLHTSLAIQVAPKGGQHVLHSMSWQPWP